MAADRRYWDSNAFLGWLSNEKDKAEDCGAVIDAAMEGRLEIVTSALSLTEVIRKKGAKRIPKDDERKIREFFEWPWIVVRTVDRFVAERARELIWEHDLKSADAVHLATALLLKLSIMDTYDVELIALDGKLGNPPLRIGHPSLPHTPDLFPGTKQEAPAKPRKRRKKPA
ncbi:MAG: type II toxin-antitoxin system VapC family toxin [Burkholderiales bacterium]